MGAKHTHGPWRLSSASSLWVIGGGEFLAAVYKPGDVDEKPLAGETWLDAQKRIDVKHEALEEEAQANARLIATAPDMLEALKEIEGGHCPIELEDDDNPTYDELRQMYVWSQLVARRAVLKATEAFGKSGE